MLLGMPSLEEQRHPVRPLPWPGRGAGEGIRTPDPLITNQMLYQLSYASNTDPAVRDKVDTVAWRSTAPQANFPLDG
jgi:hypothetical protein